MPLARDLREVHLQAIARCDPETVTEWAGLFALACSLLWRRLPDVIGPFRALPPDLRDPRDRNDSVRFQITIFCWVPLLGEIRSDRSQGVGDRELLVAAEWAILIGPSALGDTGNPPVVGPFRAAPVKLFMGP